MIDAFDRIPCGVATLASGGRFLQVNETLCAWLGYSREELCEKRFQDILTVGCRLFHQTHWEPLLQMQGSVAEVQLDMVTRDRRPIPVLINASRKHPQRPDCETEIAVFVAMDRRKYEQELLLAKRRAEELIVMVERREREFRMLAENSPDVIARFNNELVCVYLNPAATPFLEEPRDALLGRRIDDIPLLAPLAEKVAGALEGREATAEVVVPRADGERRELEARVAPERDGNGVVVTALTMIRDVTALRAEERAAKQRALVAEQLMGIVSHDLRNPLNTVMLAAQLLASPNIKNGPQVVQRITSAAQRANRLVSDLLDFTRARLGGGLIADPQSIDLHTLVADSLEELRIAWPARTLVHEMTGSGAGRADPDRVTQVLGNLVSNACVYGTPEKPVTVRSIGSQDGLELSVHNEGPAIPESLKPHVFEPLRRGTEHGSDRSIGFGLYIVREIAMAHGGTVEVRSADTEGTTFVVRFPM